MSWDHFGLRVKEVRIYFLNKDLNNLIEAEMFGWEVDPIEKLDILNELDSLSFEYNKILVRIKVRDARYGQTAKTITITIKLRFVYCDGVWHRITYPQTK